MSGESRHPDDGIMFDPGGLDRIGEIVGRYKRIWVIAGRSHDESAERVQRAIGGRYAGRIDRVIQHVPWETVQAAVAVTAGSDALVAIGGGSAIGLAKAVAVETAVPIVAVPTTYAGSEMTSIYGVTRDGRKVTARSDRALPRTVIYDPLLTLDMPASLTATSGMNAVAHCVEALYAEQPTESSTANAEAGLGLLARGLPDVIDDPASIQARRSVLMGASLAGAALNEVGMAIHHRICHILGGTFGIDHGQANSVILPQAAWFNAPFAQVAMDRVAQAIGAASAPAGLFDLAVRIGAPVSLAAIGLAERDLDEVARLTVAAGGWNPRPIDLDGVRALLDRAYRGTRPSGTMVSSIR